MRNPGIAVYFDTNSLRSKSGGYEMLSSPELLELREIAAALGVPLCIPEVVVEEWLDFLERRLEEVLQSIARNSEFVGAILGREPLSVEAMNGDEVLRQLREAHRQRLISNGFEIVTTPDLSFTVLIAEAVKKVPPFGHADKGFRDTVIFETIARDAVQRKADSVVLISNEKWPSTVLKRLEAHGVRGGVFTLPEVVKHLKDSLQTAMKAMLDRREHAAREFLERNRPLIEAHIRQARVHLEPSSFLGPSDNDDPLRYGRLEEVLGYRIGEIQSVWPGFGQVEDLKARGRYPLYFRVAVELDVVLVEPTLTASLLRGRVVSLEDSRVMRMEEDFPFPLETRTNRVLKRSVGVEATVALEGAEEEKYRDLQISRVRSF